MAVFLSAAGMALLPIGHDTVSGGAADFPGWPGKFEGKALVEEPLKGGEALFGARFPGKIARFRAGDDVVIMRWTCRATHRVHPLAVCLRANGWNVEPMPMARRADGDWSAFRAQKGLCSFEVREQVRAADGETFADVSSWFWCAFLGRSRSPWLVVSVVHPEAG